MTKHFYVLTIVVAIAVFLSLTGLAGEPPKSLSADSDTGKITVTDIIGREVTVSASVKKIAFFHSSTADALLILDAWDMVVGKNGWPLEPDIFPELDKITPITPPMPVQYTDANIEILLSLMPDLLILENFPFPGLNKLLADLKGIVPVVLVGTGDYSTMNESFEILGKLLNRESEAETFIAWSNGLIKRITDKLKDLTDKEKPRVFYKMSLSATGDISTGTDKLSAFAVISRIAGGINIADEIDSRGGWVWKIGQEWLVMKDYDVLVIRDLVPGGFGHKVSDPALVNQHRAKVMALPAFEKSKAARNNRVFMVIDSFFATPLSIISFAYFAKAFHPELFVDLNLETYLQDYYTRFLRSDIKVKKSVFFYPKL